MDYNKMRRSTVLYQSIVNDEKLSPATDAPNVQTMESEMLKKAPNTLAIKMDNTLSPKNPHKKLKLNSEETEFASLVGLLDISTPATILQTLTDKSLSAIQNNERLVYLGKEFLEHEIIEKYKASLLPQSSVAHRDESKNEPFNEEGLLKISRESNFMKSTKVLNGIVEVLKLDRICRYDTRQIKLSMSAPRETVFAVIGIIYLQKGQQEAKDFIAKYFFNTSQSTSCIEMSNTNAIL